MALVDTKRLKTFFTEGRMTMASVRNPARGTISYAGLNAEIRPLRAFARCLTRDRDRADDLVEATIMLASTLPRKFRDESGMKSWLFGLLRGLYYATPRATDQSPPSSGAAIKQMSGARRKRVTAFDARDFQRVFWRLADQQREVLILETASCLSRAEVAAVCGCTTAAMTARLSVAREEILSGLGACEPAASRHARSAPGGPRRVPDTPAEAAIRMTQHARYRSRRCENGRSRRSDQRSPKAP
jgi:RNA polymerase sigma-70 factor, ECF subfamily